ncbi:MAG TPA: ABC transporter ATP-binding protein [Caldisericia bacterium]|nr:ABC transporter ATP-binding protein [Caldisericia bacterium]HPF49775.1 ABC transporter ATP-binding protein [Caldisericia bacterium]HPI84336.1 ABC transporter ATP-binding protein [Caldisericia bacterium]HPQ93763.1 ABC transporter ATP-binding protein [Caldisericia bacterium]HRV74813.1 ABC transporter ATP-binding protein [Caldisericia bacterium]
MKILEIKNLNYSYPDGTKALDNINFSMDMGQKVAILGANGAGKSTLMLHLNGILDGKGKIAVCGIGLQKSTLRQIRQKVGLVFQNPDDQLFCPTVFSDVAFGPQNMGLSKVEVESKVTKALAQVGLAGFEKRSPFHLSIGEKKRVALATILSMDSELIALDEPTTNLDPRGRREITELLSKLDKSMIVITHDFDLARKLCSHCVLMARGSIVANGQTDKILADEALLYRHGLI